MLNWAINNWKSVHLENFRIMKTTEKTFDAVKFMRQEREKISKELVNLSNGEILDYFKKKRTEKSQKA